MTYKEAFDFIVKNQNGYVVKMFNTVYRKFMGSDKNATPEELADFLMGSLEEGAK